MPDPIDALAFGELVAEGQQVLVQIGDAVDGYYAWSVGTATGGPNGDGYYPLAVPGGPTVLVPSPAKIAAIAAETNAPVSMTAEAVNALPAATLSDGQEWYPAVSPDGALRRYRPHMFAARRTADLQALSRLVGNELLPALTEAGPSGLERRIALDEIHRKFTGVINPKMPPFNCKGDCQISEKGSTSAGSNVVTLVEAMFRAEDVGKLIYVSNNATSGANFQSAITEVISATQARCAANLVANRNENVQVVWGTDDTVGMKAAIEAARSRGTYVYGGVVLLPPGMYLTEPLTYPARIAIKGVGRRQSMLVRKPWGPSVVNDIWHLRNENTMVDFNVFQDFGLHGLKYQQNKGGGGLQFFSVPSSQLTPQNDPYPFWSHMLITDHTYHGIETFYRHSGDITMLEIVGTFGTGWRNYSYDVNVVNMLSIGNWGPGVEMASGGCNINNLKTSYNGVNGYFLPANEGNCNLLVSGSGNNITNARLQESLGSNLVVTGYNNKFGDMSLEDAGCIAFEHATGTAPALRAQLYLKGANCVGNLLNDVAFGRAVHENGDHMTHALFLSGNASGNKGRMWERPGSNYDVAQVGTDSSGGIGATNKIRIDDVPII
ncbi:MAG: hypothetical protein ACK4M2_01750 [Brevundimonas sp.]